MSFLTGSQPRVIPEFTGLQVNTSVQVIPIPIIYGSPKIPINLIYYNGFQAKLASQGDGGGKGILTGGKGGSQQVEYFATVILALGEGLIPKVLMIFQDQEVWTPATFPTNGAFYFGGDGVSAPWSYITANWPQDARTYKNTAYYGFSNGQLDSSATVPQINLVVQGLLAGTSPLNNSIVHITTGQYDSNGNPISFIGDISLGDADADPAQVIYDYLTNSRYGATFPIAFIDTTSLFTSTSGFNPLIGDSALSTYCQAIGLAWSVVLNNAESANSRLERWSKNLNVAPVWNGAKLRFIPYWDAFNSNNPGWDSTNGVAKKYFSPFLSPIVTITLDQILQSEDKGEDPITWSRKDPLEVYNTVRIDFKDRANFWNDAPIEAKDEAHIELFGPRIDNIGLADEFSLSTYANTAAQMLLRRNIAVLRNFTWKMGPLWGWLDPMDVVAIPDPSNYSSTLLVRLTSIEDDESENITVMAEEFTPGSQSPTIIPVSPTTPPNMGLSNIPASVSTTPVMFAPTLDMLTSTGFAGPQWVFGASGARNGILDPMWGGVNIWVSLDNISYQWIGTLTGASTIGTITAPLPGYGGANPDIIDILTVNLSESDGGLPTVSDQAAVAGYTTCVLQDASGFEILMYTTATLVGPFTYALTGLYRGFYGTTPRFFGAGSRFLYIGGAITGVGLNSATSFFEVALPPAYVGKTFWVKPQSFNIFNTTTQELIDTVAYQYVATSPTPVPPAPPPLIAPTYRRRIGLKSVAGPRRKRN